MNLFSCQLFSIKLANILFTLCFPPPQKKHNGNVRPHREKADSIVHLHQNENFYRKLYNAATASEQTGDRQGLFIVLIYFTIINIIEHYKHKILSMTMRMRENIQRF